eukprot:12827696-Prorocentrum_lima.AAC.1
MRASASRHPWTSSAVPGRQVPLPRPHSHEPCCRRPPSVCCGWSGGSVRAAVGGVGKDDDSLSRRL